MTIYFQEAFDLLTSGPGSLAYHLVTSFSILITLIITFITWRNDQTRQYVRLVVGMSVMLALKLLLFIVAGLAWQGLTSAVGYLPILERGVDLFSLMLLVWLWVSPAPDRWWDSMLVVFGLLLLVAIVFLFPAANRLPAFSPEGPENFSHLGWLLFFMVSLVGCIILALQRSPAWVLGSLSFGFIGMACLGSYASKLNLVEYSGLIRLGQLAAYPLMIALPLRLAAMPEPKEPLINDSQLPNGAVLAEIAKQMEADICLVALPAGRSGKRVIPFGYNMKDDQKLGEVSASDQMMPVLGGAFQHGKIIRLPANSTAPDLKEIARTLGIERSGSLIAQTLPAQDKLPPFQVILISPFSDRNWYATDETRLSECLAPLAHILQQKLSGI